MAKVTGPLFSIEARGKIADAMVHFPWKGKNVVREWKKPSNPQTGAQGDARLILGGLGRACGAAAKDSQYAEYARACADTGQTWVSTVVRYIIDTYMNTATKYEAEVTALAAHDAAASLATRSAALGLLVFDVDYKITANAFSAALMMYELAQFGCQMHLATPAKFNEEPYLTAFVDWEDAQVVALAIDLASIT